MTDQISRKRILWCARCRHPGSSLVYLSDHNHYCWDCADELHRAKGLTAIGKRSEDIDPWS